MPKDVLITPGSGLIDFKDTAGVSDATIQLNDSGDLIISNPAGNISLGNTAAHVYIGDGTSSVDVIFEQNGAIRALSGKTITLGQSNSYVTVAAPTTFASTASTVTFASANPTISASSYIHFPGGAYFNSASVYTEASLKARGGLVNDTGTKILTVVNTSQLSVANTMSSTSTTTGALLVAGGAGIAGQVTAGNVMTSSGVYWANGAPYSSGGGGAIATTGVFLNSNVITANATISSGQNGFSVGPMTQSNGVVVTIAPGQRWVIV